MIIAPICRTADIPNHCGVAGIIDGYQVAVFNVDGQYYAIDNYDRASGANVLSRGIVCTVNDELCIASPVYKEHYSLLTGECLERPECSVRSHAVIVENGTVKVELNRGLIAA